MSSLDGNECVLTGAVIQDASGYNWYGDLFHTIEDGFQLRGIPPNLQPWQGVEPQAWTSSILTTERGRWRDTQPGIALEAPSIDFIKHCREWYPLLAKNLGWIES